MARRRRDLRDAIALVDEAGRQLGATSKLEAHLAPGKLHRAFSVVLFDPDGRILIQRRAGSKYHFAGLWSNSCCGHPSPGQDAIEAASRRLVDELGLTISPEDLDTAGEVTYRVVDPVSGLVEFELNQVIVGRVVGSPSPRPSEVAAVSFVSPDELRRGALAGQMTPWSPMVLRAAMPAVNRAP